ncbi:hypothetical protein PT7_1497 [Pusillimonas sp. T7-7]|uniref:hypothetical protein n=1 Tax=Pusillimonas sp. (strain T7-7) TaxID=1007105 RepID=UPI0002084DCE|nr:hypothetical protein [Pusillimonas sp. T7-7]AEC20037.1 hypothetical protein PT7_1497 [Pusillimonas sp. T7-7]
MGMESLVILHPETVSKHLLLAAAQLLPESPLTHHPRTLDSPELLQVKCTQVTATAYGLVRLVLKDDDPPVSVAVRPDLIVAVLDVGEGMPVGFLPDLDSNPAVPPDCQEKRQVL